MADLSPTTSNISQFANHINSLLPQTQCRQCGFDGCEPYALALAQGKAPPNLCPPGGISLWKNLVALISEYTGNTTDQTHAPPPSWQAQVAVIDPHACIGCYKCVGACPVDAIVGIPKHLHQIISGACTGCDLCLPVCPVDCISMHPVTDHVTVRNSSARQQLYNQRQLAWNNKNVHLHAANTSKTARRKTHIAMSLTKQLKKISTGDGIRISRLHHALQRAQQLGDQQAIQRLTTQLADIGNNGQQSK